MSRQFLTKALVHTVTLLLICTFGSMGVFSAAGACAAMFGPDILSTALGDSPDRTHPAFITFVLMLFPAMYISFVGMTFGIILPLHIKFKIPMERHHESTRKLLHAYSTSIAAYTKPKD